jgi:hypothetical protein
LAIHLYSHFKLPKFGQESMSVNQSYICDPKPQDWGMRRNHRIFIENS